MLHKVEGPTATTPTEDLIPEAREHQRRRYLRSGLFAVICTLFIAVVIVAGVILMGGRSNPSRTTLPELAGQCSSAHLSLSQGLAVSAPSQNDMLLVTLTNMSDTSCQLVGYPHVAFRDKSGRVLPFDYRQGGNRYLWVTHRSPATVQLAPRAVAYLLIDKTPCSGASDQAVSLSIIPPGNTKPLPLTWSEPFISYCGGGDLGHVVALSPIESSPDAVYGTT